LMRSIYEKGFNHRITGQDGSYLAELLLFKGYEVHGIIRRASTFNTRRIDHIYSDPHTSNVHHNLHLHYGDLDSTGNLMDLIYNIRPMKFTIWQHKAMYALVSTCRIYWKYHRIRSSKDT